VAELADALDLGSSGATRESSSLSFRTRLKKRFKEDIMQVTVETITALERKMSVSVPAEMIDQEINKRLKKTMQTARIDGFRPGKATEQVIKQRFGYAIESEALNEIVRHSLSDALKKEDLTPVGQPELHFEAPYKTGNAFSYTATFEVFPQVTLQPFNDLVIEKLTAEITPEDVDNTLTGMQKQQILWQIVDLPAKEGDKVWINFEGRINNEPFEGGKAENVAVILGSKSMIPGFEEGLIGVTPGQDTTLETTFPENYHAKDLAGKAAQFITHVNKIEEPLLPEINDDFAAKFGVTEGGVEKLREEVRETLIKQLSLTLRNQLKTEVMSKLAKAYKDLNIPKTLIQGEAEHLRKQMLEQFAQFRQGQSAKLPELSLDMFTDRAKERVILGFVVNAIVSEYHLKPEAATVRKLIETLAERYDQPEKIIHAYYQDKERLANIESLAIEEQVVDKILTEAMVVEKPGKASEILNPAGAP
jgi:trigger factor